MRALVFDGPAPDARTTRVAELPVPAPGPGEVTLDVHHAGVNFKDVMARRGDPGYVATWPYVPGLEAADTIRALGPGVSGLATVLDPQGTELLDLDLQAAAPGARIILFGNAPGAPLAPLPSVTRLFATNTSIGGFSLSALAAAAPSRVAAALRGVLDHLTNGSLTIERTTIEGLANVPEAQQALAEGRARGKQIVRVGPTTAEAPRSRP